MAMNGETLSIILCDKNSMVHGLTFRTWSRHKMRKLGGKEIYIAVCCQLYMSNFALNNNTEDLTVWPSRYTTEGSTKVQHGFNS